MKRGGRGQISVEYMIVLGMAMLLLLPGGYLFYLFSQGTTDQLTSARIARGGAELVNTVEAMYAVGRNSWSTVNINFPDNVVDVYVEGGKEIVILYETQNGLSEAVFFSNVNVTAPYSQGRISGDFKPGFSRIKVSYNKSSIVIEEMTQ